MQPKGAGYNKFIFGLITTLICLGFSVISFADDGYPPVFKPEVNISQAAGEIKIDGNLDDAGWNNAAICDHFVENKPGDQIKPPVETKGYIAYDDNYLYVAIVCYDNPEDIRASFCERDRIYNDDNVGFFFDTYGDGSWAYTLNVNPYGIQADGLWTNGFGEDSKYDLIWKSAGQITDSGYQVEIAIPFSSLRFPNKEKQNWRIEFWRHHSRDVHHNISWSAYDRDEPCWACQWGYMNGLENVKPGKGIEIIPSFVGIQSGEATAFYDSTDTIIDSLIFNNDDADADVSLNFKYAITSSATIEATYNPDFSQVEANADQIDVNTTVALFFPEKRPFFQEGRDLFRTLFNTVYTRSINKPDFAAKFTARINRTSIAYLGAHDEVSPFIIPFEEHSKSFSLGKSTSNFFRIRQTFGENSQVGALVTDRRYEGGGSGSVLGLDGSFRLHQSLRFKIQTLASYIEEPNDTSLTANRKTYDNISESNVLLSDYTFGSNDQYTAGFDGEEFWGHAVTGILDYEVRDLYISARLSRISDAYRADNGFEPRNNRQQVFFIADKNFWFDGGLVERFSPQIFAARIWNMDGRIKDEWVMAELSYDLRKYQASFDTRFMISHENFADIQFDDIWNISHDFEFVPNEYISFGGTINYGNRIARYAKVMGKEFSFRTGIDLRPFDRLLSEFSYNYIQSRANETKELLFSGHVLRNKISLQLSRELSFRFVVQYNEFEKTWDFDPLITYRLSPFSLFYIGSTYDYQEYTNYRQLGTNATRLLSRQFFMKLQYQFQL
ncbi:MAG: carbohydrate binding family 9 domain-containing protein [candidate division Zixibacteria bacterium]|nr:carbohydrate binding family 9 domain-containing protein [candidate division Zixibacteria bacterium]